SGALRGWREDDVMALRHTAPPGGREPAAVPRRLSNGVTLMTLVTQGGSLPGGSARSAPGKVAARTGEPTDGGVGGRERGAGGAGAVGAAAEDGPGRGAAHPYRAGARRGRRIPANLGLRTLALRGPRALRTLRRVHVALGRRRSRALAPRDAFLIRRVPVASFVRLGRCSGGGVAAGRVAGVGGCGRLGWGGSGASSIRIGRGLTCAAAQRVRRGRGSRSSATASAMRRREGASVSAGGEPT